MQLCENFHNPSTEKINHESSIVPSPGQAANRGRLDASRPAESDADLSFLDDDRDAAAPATVVEHALHGRIAQRDIDILERHLPFGEILTGRPGVRSGVFPKHVVHWRVSLAPRVGMRSPGRIRHAMISRSSRLRTAAGMAVDRCAP